VSRLELSGNAAIVEDILKALLADIPALKEHLDLLHPWQQQVLIIRDSHLVTAGELINDGDTLLLLPPLTGG